MSTWISSMDITHKVKDLLEDDDVLSVSNQAQLLQAAAIANLASVMGDQAKALERIERIFGDSFLRAIREGHSSNARAINGLADSVETVAMKIAQIR